MTGMSHLENSNEQNLCVPRRKKKNGECKREINDERRPKRRKTRVRERWSHRISGTSVENAENGDGEAKCELIGRMKMQHENGSG